MYTIGISSIYEDLTYKCFQGTSFKTIEEACNAFAKLIKQEKKNLIPYCFAKDSEEIRDYVSELPIDASIFATLADQERFENLGYMSGDTYYVSAYLEYSISEDWNIDFADDWRITINPDILESKHKLLSIIKKALTNPS